MNIDPLIYPALPRLDIWPESLGWLAAQRWQPRGSNPLPQVVTQDSKVLRDVGMPRLKDPSFGQMILPLK